MQQPSPVQPSIAQLRGQQENVIVASIAVVDKESSSGPSEWRGGGEALSVERGILQGEQYVSEQF